MENEQLSTQEHPQEQAQIPPASKKDYLLPASMLISTVILASVIIYAVGANSVNNSGSASAIESFGINQKSSLEEKVLPPSGVVLPVRWGDMGMQLVSAGVIDANAFKRIYEQRGEFTKEYSDLLYGSNNGKLKMTEENAGYLLNLLWAFGLGNKNDVLDFGEMQNRAYGGAGNFASTGGWTIAKGDAMDHYSTHTFATLTATQQAIVERISRGVYRPCCGNSTHFPDCNHGMAMLGLLELMASQGVSEVEMWKTALAVNSYWFPGTYVTIASYMQDQGVAWDNVDPQEMLGANYSSSSGFARISLLVSEPQESRGGNGCGVDSGTVVAPQRSQGGCGI